MEQSFTEIVDEEMKELVLINYSVFETRQIKKYMIKNNFKLPSLETVCIVRNKISNKQLKALGISWVISLGKKRLSFCIGGYTESKEYFSLFPEHGNFIDVCKFI